MCKRKKYTLCFLSFTRKDPLFLLREKRKKENNMNSKDKAKCSKVNNKGTATYLLKA